jgi:hypothetical protein
VRWVTHPSFRRNPKFQPNWIRGLEQLGHSPPESCGCLRPPGLKMSALGHEQTSRHVRFMSAIPVKADIHQRGLHVRLVP